MLEACLNMYPEAIPGGQRLLESGLSDAAVEAACSGRSSGGWGQDAPSAVVSLLCKEMLLYLQAVKGEKAEVAFYHYRGAYRVFVEDNALLGFRGGQSGWLLSTLATMSRGLRVLADETSIDDEKAQADVTGLLHTAFSACLRDRSTDPAESKKSMAMHMAVVLFKHLFKINNVRMCLDLSKNIRGGKGDAEGMASRADVVGFLYHEGRTIMRTIARDDQHQRAHAEQTLTRALQECDGNATGNRRRILASLVPLRMRMGCLPERRLLEKHNLLIYDDLCTAVRQGDLKMFSLLLKQHFFTLEISDLGTHLENCRLVVYRQVLKQIVAATGEHVLPLSVVKLGFVLRGHEFLVDHPDESLSLSIEDQELARYDELKGTLSLLINHGLIAGVIRSGNGKLQLSKKTPFPPLPGRSDRGLHRGRRRSGFV
eukprot:g10560.t1